tara:strand:- start:89 stop:316 length:228 start_codon:yes stop_codon:yes gene_type:complete
MKIFGLKIITQKKYNTLLDRIIECKNVYKSKIPNTDYSTQGRSVNVKLSDLGKICNIENIFYDDIKKRLENDKKS